MSNPKQRGISAKNQDFIRYDQVGKQQEYRLAEAPPAAAAEQFDEEFRVKTCDIGRFLRGNAADRERFARELGAALQEIGFAILEGHGIDAALFDEASERVLELFTRASEQEK